MSSGRASDKSDPVASWFGNSMAGSGVKWASTATGGFAVVQALGMHVQLTFVSETGANLYCANFTSNRVVTDPVSTAGPTVMPTISPSKPTVKPTGAPSTSSPVANNGATCSLMAASSHALSVIVFGDWGTGSTEQYTVANQVSTYLKQPTNDQVIFQDLTVIDSHSFFY